MDFQYCPKCEAFNPPGITHCEQCKAELPPVEDFAPAPGAGEPMSPEPAEAAAADPSAPAATPAPVAPEPPPLEAPPEVLAKVQQLEAEIVKKPGANALYLQLSQVYLNAKRKDLAAQVIERCLERDPKNAYLRHRLAQITGAPAPGTTAPSVPAGASPAPGSPAPAPVPGSPAPAPGAAVPPSGARPRFAAAPVGMPVRPAYRPAPPRRRRVSRWMILGGLVVAVALGVGIKLLFFPGPKRVVSGPYSAIAPKWSPTGGHIAFILVEPSRTLLAVYDVKAGQHRDIADIAGSDASAFAWSPNGRRIAYVGRSEQGWGQAVSVVEVDTGQTRRVADGRMPVWAPDGKTLLMWCEAETGSTDSDSPVLDDEDGAVGAPESYGVRQSSGPCRVNVQTGAVTRRPEEIEELSWAGEAVVSPVLGKIAFERFEGNSPASPAPVSKSGDGEFVDMVDSVAARGATNLAEGSRDLSRELEAREYARKRDKAKPGSSFLRNLYVTDFEGGPTRQLTVDGASGEPTWTPDGQRLLFVSNGALASMKPDGTGRQEVFKGSLKLAEPVAAQMSADGRQIVFVAEVEGDPGLALTMTGESPADLFVAEVGASRAKRLANRHPFKQRFALSPDGKRIVYEVLAEPPTLTKKEGRSELWLMRR